MRGVALSIHRTSAVKLNSPGMKSGKWESDNRAFRAAKPMGETTELQIRDTAREKE